MARPRSFVLVGNSVALDFVNTELREPTGPVELLTSDAALAEWAVAVGLGRSARGVRARTDRIDRRVRPLREALRQIVDAQIDGRRAPARALSIVNELLAIPAPVAPLLQRGGRLVRGSTDDLTPRRILQRVAEEAADFFTRADPALLRRCGNTGCILLFYDSSKSHRRRWCSMDLCGNRAKARSYYARRARES